MYSDKNLLYSLSILEAIEKVFQTVQPLGVFKDDLFLLMQYEQYTHIEYLFQHLGVYLS
jgi:hypothetical protein